MSFFAVTLGMVFIAILFGGLLPCAILLWRHVLEDWRRK